MTPEKTRAARSRTYVCGEHTLVWSTNQQSEESDRGTEWLFLHPYGEKKSYLIFKQLLWQILGVTKLSTFTITICLKSRSLGQLLQRVFRI